MEENVTTFREVRLAAAHWFNTKIGWLNSQGILTTIEKNTEKSLVVYLNFGKCMASLVVAAGDYAPYRFVAFEAISMLDDNTNIIYAWYDDETTSANEVLLQLDKAIDYVYEFNIRTPSTTSEKEKVPFVGQTKELEPESKPKHKKLSNPVRKKRWKDMVTGYRRTWTHIIFTYFKKHYCPYCGVQMQIITCEKIVNSHSDEAKNYDFDFFDGYATGNVKFVWDELKCYGCGFQITAKEMKKYERSLR